MKKENKYLAGALLIFLSFQLVYLFFSPFVFYHEDQKVTTLGIDLLNGRLRLPFWFYLDSPHLGGSIYTAIFAIPFYLFFGKNYLALKMSGLFLAAMNFLVLGKFLIREYGVKILLPFSLLFTIPPTRLLMHYFARPGNTIEMILVTSLSLISAYCFIKSGARNNRRAFFLGFLASFGLWIQYNHLATILAVIIVWFLADKKFFLKKIFVFFLSGFLIGALPFLVFNFQYDFASFRADQITDLGIFNIDLKKLPGRTLGFFRFVLPRSFLLLSASSFGESLASLIFYFLVILSLVILVISAFRKKERFVFFLLVFLATSIASMIFLNAPLNDFPADKYAQAEEVSVFSYYYPGFLHPLLLIGLAVFLFRLLKAKQKLFKKLGYLFFALLLFVLGNNFWANIKNPNIAEIEGKNVGFPTTEPLVNVLDIVPVNTDFHFNRYLFEPHEDIYANAYESGYQFSRNPRLFDRLIKKLTLKYRESFIIGAGNSFNRLLRKGLQVKDEKLFLELIKNFSLEEKEVFLYNALTGESIWFGGGREIIFQAYNQLEAIDGLSSKDKEILEAQLNQIMTSEENDESFTD